METLDAVKQYLVEQDAKAVILFDGVCNFCNATINFLIKHDKYRSLRYASLQSEIGIAIQQELPSPTDSIIVVDKETIYIQSEAVIQIAKLLPYPYQSAKLIGILPKNWRDTWYTFIASRRYRWFGKSTRCRVSSDEERKLFMNTTQVYCI